MKRLNNIQTLDPVIHTDALEYVPGSYVSHADLLDLIQSGIDAPSVGSLTYDPEGETAVDPLYSFGMDRLELAQHLGTSPASPAASPVSDEEQNPGAASE